MEVLIAKHSGFCEGVERAYRIALEQTKAGTAVFMLGNLVHNTQVIEKFKKLGVKTVKKVSEIPDGTQGILLISAHGVPPAIYKQAEDKGLKIVDTTCAWVKKAQRIAKDFADEGRRVIIVGDKGHTEVKGLVGWSNNKAEVIEKLDDLRALSLSSGEKVGILAQTTQSEDHFKALAAEIRKTVKDVKEMDTICGATSKRQSAAVELARKVNLILVIGDKMSANTKRLTELCTATGTETHQIQNAAELEAQWLAGKGKIGLTAGASTPEWVINEVLHMIKDRR